MKEIKVETYYKGVAKELTDMLFDKNFLNSELTRESIAWMEDYLGFIMQSRCEMAVKCAELTASLKEE